MSKEREPGGYLVVGRHKDRDEEWEPGDVYDIYPVLGQAFMYIAPPAEGEPVPNPHTLAREEGAKAQAERGRLRILSQTGCTCRRKRAKPLAVAYARQGRVWVWVAPQYFPAAVRDDVLAFRQGGARMWPAHYEPSGREHVDLATCRDCRRHWAVMIHDRGYRMVELGTPTFGGILQP